MANEVVTRRKRLGNNGFPVQVLEDLGRAPVTSRKGRRCHAFLVDLAVPVNTKVDMIEMLGMHTLNHFFPLPSQLLKSPEHLYIQTMTGPCSCVHCFQLARIFPPAATLAERSADVPPLHMTFLSLTLIVGL